MIERAVLTRKLKRAALLARHPIAEYPSIRRKAAELRRALEVRLHPLDGASVEAARRHVLDRLDATETSVTPFWHVCLDDLLPEELYVALDAHRKERLERGATRERSQDSPEYRTRRANFADDVHPAVRTLRAEPALPLEALIAREEDTHARGEKSR